MRAVALALALCGIGGAACADAAWCPDLKRVVDLTVAKDKFAYIAGTPREGDFRATTMTLAVVLMDEPFDGFDLRQARAIADVLRRAAANGRTFVLAIHQLADAERVCDRFLLLSQGRLCGEGTLDRLRERTRLPAAHLEEIFLALT